MVITGYKMNGCELRNLEDELRRIQKKVNKEAKKITDMLMSEEVEFFIDQLSLNNLSRDNFGDKSVFEIAKESLQNKLETAKRLQTDSKYNLSCYAHIFTNEDTTYINVHFKNDAFVKIFDKSRLLPFSLSESEAVDENNAKTAKWNEIFKNYNETIDPLTINFIPTLPEITDENLTFRSPLERAEDIAIFNTTNRYISHLTGGQQVSPIEMMYVFSAAQERLTTEEGKQFIKEDRMALQSILPNITNELINIHPSDTIQPEEEKGNEK